MYAEEAPFLSAVYLGTYFRWMSRFKNTSKDTVILGSRVTWDVGFGGVVEDEQL